MGTTIRLGGVPLPPPADRPLEHTPGEGIRGTAEKDKETSDDRPPPPTFKRESLSSEKDD